MVAISHLVLHEAPPVAGVRRDYVQPFRGRAPRLSAVRADAETAASDTAPFLGGVQEPARAVETKSNSVAIAVCVSIVFHALVLGWSFHLPFAREAAGNAEETVIEGISVILLGEVPSVSAKQSEKTIEATAIADSEMIVPDELAMGAADAATPPSVSDAIADSEMASAASLDFANLPLAEEEAVAKPVGGPSASDVPDAAAEEAIGPTSDPGPDVAESASSPAPPQGATLPSERAADSEVLAKDLPDNIEAPTTLDEESVSSELTARADSSAETAHGETPREETVDTGPSQNPVAAPPAPPIVAARTADPVAAPTQERAVQKPVPVVEKDGGAIQKRASKPKPVKASATAQGDEERGRVSASSYRAQLAAHLRRYRSYPEAARQLGLSGTARVSFTVNSKGHVTGARLTGSSGHVLLDRAAIGMVRRASPFPPIPRQVGISVLTVDVPVRFDRR